MEGANCPGGWCVIIGTLRRWSELFPQLEAIDTSSNTGTASSRRTFRIDNREEESNAALDRIDVFLRDASEDLAQALSPVSDIDNNCARRISDRFAQVSHILSNLSEAQGEISESARAELVKGIHELLREIAIRC